jgi:hypothetical protein
MLERVISISTTGEHAMFDKISYTWSLMGASWNVLRADKEILVFPLLSGICCLAVMASFALPMFLTGGWQPPDHDQATAAQQVVYYAVLFAFYFANYFVIAFFNTAIVACAVSRMAGGDPTVAGGFREALARIHLVAGWALVSATVGLLLRIIEDRSSKVGRVVAGLLGMAWTVMTYLVVPVLVIEQVGPIEAVKRSTALLKATWGEQIVGNFSFGLVFFLLGLPGFIALAIGVMGISRGAGAVAPVLAITLIVLAAIYLIALSLIQSALQAIFQAAVYLYAQGDVRPGGFPVDLVRSAMGPKT